MVAQMGNSSAAQQVIDAQSKQYRVASLVKNGALQYALNFSYPNNTPPGIIGGGAIWQPAIGPVVGPTSETRGRESRFYAPPRNNTENHLIIHY